MFIPKKDSGGTGSIVLVLFGLIAIPIAISVAVFVIVDGVNGDLLAPATDGRLKGFPIVITVAPLATIALASFVAFIWLTILLVRER